MTWPAAKHLAASTEAQMQDPALSETQKPSWGGGKGSGWGGSSHINPCGGDPPPLLPPPHHLGLQASLWGRPGRPGPSSRNFNSSLRGCPVSCMVFSSTLGLPLTRYEQHPIPQL